MCASALVKQIGVIIKGRLSNSQFSHIHWTCLLQMRNRFRGEGRVVASERLSNFS